MKPIKKSEKTVPHAAHHAVNTVTNHRLAEGAHSNVFPNHIGQSHWHPGSRNGHPGSHTVKSRGR